MFVDEERNARHTARLRLGLVPDAVRKAISAEELEDRLAEVEKLSAKANDPSVDAAERLKAKATASRILSAQPRAETLRQQAALISKAAATANPDQAEAIRRDAERLVEEHPTAPRRGLEGIRQRHAARVGVGKAKKADKVPLPVFDANGNLVGVLEDPDDLMPVAGKKADPAPVTAPAQPADQAAVDPAGAQPVAKAWRTTVYDQWGNQIAADRRRILPLGVRKAAGDDLVEVTDSSGRMFRVSRAALDPPEVQALNRGPVNAGGSTGLGQPRMTGPAAALPGDGPQARRAGDAPGRQVVKSLDSGWTDVHTRAGKLVGVMKQGDLLEDDAVTRLYCRTQGVQNFCSVYDAAGKRLGFAFRPNVLGTRG